MRPLSPGTEDGFWRSLKRSGLTSTDLWMHLPPLPQNGGAVVERTSGDQQRATAGAPLRYPEDYQITNRRFNQGGGGASAASHCSTCEESVSSLRVLVPRSLVSIGFGGVGSSALGAGHGRIGAQSAGNNPRGNDLLLNFLVERPGTAATHRKCRADLIFDDLITFRPRNQGAGEGSAASFC